MAGIMPATRDKIGVIIKIKISDSILKVLGMELPKKRGLKREWPCKLLIKPIKEFRCFRVKIAARVPKRLLKRPIKIPQMPKIIGQIYVNGLVR